MGMRLASMFVDITANDSQFRSDMANTRKTVGQEMASLAGSFAALGAIGLAGAGFLKLAADAETTATAMNVIIKDLDKTTELLKELDKFSVITPFTPKEVREAGSALVAMKNATEDIPGILQTLGDAAAGSNIALSEMTRIFNKVQIEGKLTQETFQQLGAVGPSVLTALQEQLGKTREEVKKMQSQGKISFEIFAEALKSTTEAGGTFFEAMDAQSKTLNGLLSTMEGNFVAIAEAIGNKMMPVAKALLGQVIRMANAFSAFDAATNGAATAVIVLTGAVVALGLAFKITSRLGMVLVRTLAIAALSNPFTAVLLAIGLVVAGIALAIGWVSKLQVVQDAWTAATVKLQDAWENVKSALGAIFSAIQTAAINAFKSIAEALGFETSNMKDSFAGIVGDMIDRIAEFALDASEWFRVIAENWGQVWEIIKLTITIASAFVFDIFRNYPRIAAFAWGKMISIAIDVFTTIADFIVTVMNAAIQKVMGFFRMLGELMFEAITNPAGLAKAFKQAGKIAAKEIAAIAANFQAGLGGGQLDLELTDVSEEKKRIGEITKALGEAKRDLEQQRTDLTEEDIPEEQAAEAIKEVKEALSKPLNLKVGFSGLDQLTRSMQDAVLKAESPEQKMLGAVEIGNATAKRQEEIAKKQLEATKEIKPEVATA